MSRPANPVAVPLADYSPKHFLLAVVDGVATVTLNRPERKNPLTFESYRELTDFFRACAFDDDVKVVVVTGAGGNFSSGGDDRLRTSPHRLHKIAGHAGEGGQPLGVHLHERAD